MNLEDWKPPSFKNTRSAILRYLHKKDSCTLDALTNYVEEWTGKDTPQWKVLDRIKQANKVLARFHQVIEVDGKHVTRTSIFKLKTKKKEEKKEQRELKGKHTPLPKVEFKGKTQNLDHRLKAKPVQEFETYMDTNVMGQKSAAKMYTDLFTKIEAGLYDEFHPRGVALLLGPTGTGKTLSVEKLTEWYLGDRRHMIKLACGELGNVTTKRLAEQFLNAETAESLNTTTKDGRKLSVLLIDEIEKASVRLWKILLNVLEKGVMNLGGEELDLTHCIIIMTSNLGAFDILRLLRKHKVTKLTDSLIEKIHTISVEAARNKWSPEFFNRIDEIITFNPLMRDTVLQIIDLELQNIERIMGVHEIRLKATDKAKDKLIRECYDLEMGARALKRGMNKMIVNPLASMIVAQQVNRGDRVLIDSERNELVFRRIKEDGSTVKSNGTAKTQIAF